MGIYIKIKLSVALLYFLQTVPFVSGEYRHSYMGCFKDGSRFRALSERYYRDYPTNTVEFCVYFCAAANYVYAGLQNGDECFCDNSGYDRYGVGYDCTLSCTGNLSQACGGRFHNSVYLITFVQPTATTTTTTHTTTTITTTITAMNDSSNGSTSASTFKNSMKSLTKVTGITPPTNRNERNTGKNIGVGIGAVAGCAIMVLVVVIVVLPCRCTMFEKSAASAAAKSGCVAAVDLGGVVHPDSESEDSTKNAFTSLNGILDLPSKGQPGGGGEMVENEQSVSSSGAAVYVMDCYTVSVPLPRHSSTVSIEGNLRGILDQQSRGQPEGGGEMVDNEQSTSSSGAAVYVMDCYTVSVPLSRHSSTVSIEDAGEFPVTEDEDFQYSYADLPQRVRPGVDP